MSEQHHTLPWQVPSPTGATSPVNVQIDVKVPRDASDADKTVLMQSANKIVNDNGSLLDRFMANNRQQVSMSGTNYYNRRISGTNLNARYQYNNGQEKLKLDVYPSGGQHEDHHAHNENRDGYIVWIHGQPNYPHDVNGYGRQIAIGPFVVMMNGYVLEQSVQPRDHFTDGNCSGYAILLGKTALLCSSMMDVGKKNPLLKRSSLHPPLPLIPNVSGEIKVGVAIDGTQQKAHGETFGYWIFDWLNDLNPLKYIHRTSDGKNAQWENPIGWFPTLDQSPNAKLGQPNIWGGIYFPNVTTNKSPFNPKGLNTIGTLPSANSGIDGTGDSIVLCVDVFIAEFYDRGKFTTMSQSWMFPQGTDLSITANTKPLLFGALNEQVGYTTGNGSNMQFDLLPQNTKLSPPNPTNQNLKGPHDYFTISGYDNTGWGAGDALSDEQKARIAQWQQQNKDDFDQWSTQLQQDYQRVYNQLNTPQMQADVALAHLIATISRIYHGNVHLYSDGIFIYWKDDWMQYRINTNAPNDPPILPSWATSGVTPSDPWYNEVTAYFTWTDKGDGTSTIVRETAYDLVLPANTPTNTASIREMDAQAATEGGEGRIQYVYEEFGSVVTSYQTGTDPTRGSWVSGTANIVVQPYPWRNNNSFIVFGPGAYSAIYTQAEAMMTAIMTTFDALTKQMAEINARKPPTPTPFPNIDGDIGKFVYQKFTDWNYSNK